MSFLHYFHAAIGNHLSEKPKICLVVYDRLTQYNVSVRIMFLIFVNKTHWRGIMPRSSYELNCQGPVVRN